MTTKREFQNWLMEVIYEGSEEEIEITTFEEEGLLTRDAGLVIKLEDGSEYRLTLVKSR